MTHLLHHMKLRIPLVRDIVCEYWCNALVGWDSKVSISEIIRRKSIPARIPSVICCCYVVLSGGFCGVHGFRLRILLILCLQSCWVYYLRWDWRHGGLRFWCWNLWIRCEMYRVGLLGMKDDFLIRTAGISCHLSSVK